MIKILGRFIHLMLLSMGLCLGWVMAGGKVELNTIYFLAFINAAIALISALTDPRKPVK